MSYPDNNPKTAMGAKKVPLHLVPPSAKHFLALALANGASKYGPYNWRDAAISVSVYKAALERHMDAFWDGEDFAADSGVHHVAHAMACCALILDAMTLGKLNDDRPTTGAASRLQAEYVDPANPAAMREAKIAYDVATEEGRVPKWDPAWGKAPNCDGLSARDIRAPHPMSAEAIRDHDERLSGAEDRL